MPFWSRGEAADEPEATGRPPGARRSDWQRHLADPSVALTDPVPDLGSTAAAAGWVLGPADPGLDPSASEFVHDMVLKLHRVASLPDPNLATGGGPNRYADTVSGVVDGRPFVAGNVSFTWSFYHGGEHPVSGSFCSVGLGGLLPLAMVQPRGCEPHQRSMTKRATLGRPDFDGRFEVRSGHPDYAVALVSPLADELLRRDDWSLFVEFTDLVTVAAQPFTTAGELAERVATVSRMVALVPPDVWTEYEVRTPVAGPGPVELSPEDLERAQAAMQSLSAEERKEVVARIMTEGRDAVLRDLLGGEGDGSDRPGR
jgi:hypothetical protein